MSWKEYVQKVLVKGDKYDQAIKDKQEAKISGFLQYLKEHEHFGREYLERHNKARELYENLAAKYLNRETRSEEHTSELQSLMRISYAVFCLKKKKTKQQ